MNPVRLQKTTSNQQVAEKPDSCSIVRRQQTVKWSLTG